MNASASAVRFWWARGSAAVLLAFASCANAASVYIGERDFYLVPPAGYVQTAVYKPEVRRIFEAQLPPGSKLVELFLPKDDFNVLNSGGVPAMDSVYLWHVLAASEDKILSLEGFAEAAQVMEKGLQTPPAGVTVDGVAHREPWGVFFALRLPDGTATATALVVINYQLMALSHNVDGKQPDARRKADEGVLAWAKALRAGNPDKQYLAERAGRLDLGEGGSGGAVGGNAAFQIGRTLGIAAFLFLMYRLFRRRSN